MLKNWLENEPKVTLFCAVVSEVSLVLSITGVLRDVLPVDIAWIAIVLCGVPIVIGSDIAIESADAVLVSDDFKRLPYLFDLNQKVMEKIQVNIIASLIINFSAVLLSTFGVLTPVTGALWHNCGSVFVVINAALLLCVRDEA